jgi:hypothetical protein
MKILMTWKDPDAVPTGIAEVVAQRRKADGLHVGNLYFEVWKDPQYAELGAALDKAGIGEYLTIEYDTDTKLTRILKE